MKPANTVRYVFMLLLSSLLYAGNAAAALWELSGLQQYRLNDAAMQHLLTSAEFKMDLPLPDGSFAAYHFRNTPVLAPGLGERYPEIQTYTGTLGSDRMVTAKMTVFNNTLNIYVFNGSKSYLILSQDNIYNVFYKKDVQPRNSFRCLDAVHTKNDTPPVPQGLVVESGSERRKYRLALSCTYEYAVAVTGITTPTKTQVLAAMTTTINRVNGIYERELGVTLELVPNNDTLVFVTNSSSIFTNNNAYAMLTQNRNLINARIGTGNYDIGHVFSTGGGGLATLASICTSDKAEGVTGTDEPKDDPFDVDYVSHEMGHQLGADHTFNKCENEEMHAAFEPGSGSTIMGYAGICGNENLQVNSDDYFHAFSKYQINEWLNGPINSTCGLDIGAAVTIPPFYVGGTEYNIPAHTPFELEAPDLGADLYNWYQWDLGNFRNTQANSATFVYGPTFRSFFPTEERIRVFPETSYLLANNFSYTGERLPTVTRTLHFILDALTRDNNWGYSRTSEDTLSIHVQSNGAPFRVLHPNHPVTILKGQSTDIKWEPGNTPNWPIVCSDVNIFLSRDGGLTFTDTIGINIYNNGSYRYTFPDTLPVASTYRIKIKCADNIFFDISNTNFTLDTVLSLPEVFSDIDRHFSIYPNPGYDLLHVQPAGNSTYELMIYGINGAMLLRQDLNRDNTAVDISALPAANYILQINDTRSRNQYRKIITKTEHR